MSKTNTKKVSTKIIDNLRSAFSNRLWFSYKHKETGEYNSSSLSELQDHYDPEMYYYNLWISLNGIDPTETDKINKLAQEVASQFRGADQIVGLKYPYIAKSGTCMSLGLLPKE